MKLLTNRILAVSGLFLLLGGFADGEAQERRARERERREASRERSDSRETRSVAEERTRGTERDYDRSKAIETDRNLATERATDRGRRVEREVLTSEGLEKNTVGVETVDPKTGKTGTTIPDAMRPNGATVEVKDVKRLSDSPQLRRQSEISRQSGERAEVIITDRTESVSKTVQDRMRVRRVGEGSPQK